MAQLFLRSTAIKTLGISPKVWGPFALGAVTIVANWIISGEFDRTEIALMLMTAAKAAVGYAMKPGKVEAEMPVPIDPGATTP